MFSYDFNRHGYVYLINHNYNTFEVFMKFQSEVENQLGKKIKILHTDRGKEYLNDDFYDHLRSCRIVSQLDPPRILQHSGVSSRRNQTLLDMVHSMMTLATLRISFRSYALETAAYI